MKIASLIFLLFIFSSCSNTQLTYDERATISAQEKHLILSELKKRVLNFGPYAYTSFFNLEKDFGEKEEFHVAYFIDENSTYIFKGHPSIAPLIKKYPDPLPHDNDLEILSSKNEERSWSVIFYILSKDEKLNPNRYKVSFLISGKCDNSPCSEKEVSNLTFKQIDGGIIFEDPLASVRSNPNYLMHAKKRMIPKGVGKEFWNLFPIYYPKGEASFYDKRGKFGRLGFYCVSEEDLSCISVRYSTGLRVTSP